MSHSDPDDLAMVALGELALDGEQAQHLRDCRACADELAALERTVRAARVAPATDLLTPAPRVWEGIAAEIAREDQPLDLPADAVASAPRGAHRVRRRRRARIAVLVTGLVGAAAIALIVALLVVPRPVDIATAVLDAFPAHPGASGSAALEREPGGAERVVVELDADVPDGGHREVWLLTEDGSDLVSLGILDGGSGSFAVPADVDTTVYRVVDISQEPDDGDEAHSGDSIVRGLLEPS
jgi:hypothetical protein